MNLMIVRIIDWKVHMSPGDFRYQANVHRNEIKKAWIVVSESCEIFESDTIWPDQCDRVRRSILTLNEPVQNFTAFLGTDSITVLPYDAIPARYALLRALHRIGKAVEELTILLAMFRSNCRSASYEAVLQKFEIQRKLYGIEQENDSIQFTLDRLSFPVSAEAL
jgi:hypothetical protein